MRKGLTVGSGRKGYYNVQCNDPRVHSQSAKGIKQPQRAPYYSINPAMTKYSNLKLQEGTVQESVEHPKFSLEQARQIAKDHLTYNAKAYGKCGGKLRYIVEKEKVKGNGLVEQKIGENNEYILKIRKDYNNNKTYYFIDYKNPIKRGIITSWLHSREPLLVTESKKKAIDFMNKYDTISKGGKMSKQDYEAFAKIMGTSKNLAEADARIAFYMQEDNPKFDRIRYINATKEWDRKSKGGKGMVKRGAHEIVHDAKYLAKKGGQGVHYACGGKLKRGHIAYKFASSNKNDVEVVQSPFQSNDEAQKNPMWFEKVKKSLEKRYGQTWERTGSKEWITSSTRGGKRVRAGINFYKGDRVKQGAWTDKRWKRATTKDNKQIGKTYEDWEKHKSQRWR